MYAMKGVCLMLTAGQPVLVIPSGTHIYLQLDRC